VESSRLIKNHKYFWSKNWILSPTT